MLINVDRLNSYSLIKPTRVSRATAHLCSKYLTKSNLGEKGLTAYNSRSQSIIVKKSRKELTASFHSQERRGNKCMRPCLLACICLAFPTLTEFRTSCTGHHDTHNGLGLRTPVNHQDYTPNSCPETPTGQPDLHNSSLTPFPR